MKTIIALLKKDDKFIFNNETYIVKQKYSDWEKDGNPYLISYCGQIFWFDELEVEKYNL
jgi:hypothetical protein